jgi:hypothetical protein
MPAPFKPKIPPADVYLPDGRKVQKYNLGNGRTMWRENGKIIKAPDIQGMRSAPSTTLHEPPMATGGGIKSPMAVAYAVRRQNRAEGGQVHAGPIMSAVPGRTDNHPMDVAEGSYVIPSETVSHLGENNTNAGMEVLGRMFGPDGALGGGASQGASPVPINAAGGEFVIPPEVVATIGGGDIKKGHEILDSWIMASRKKHISTLRRLAPPAKS